MSVKFSEFSIGTIGADLEIVGYNSATPTNVQVSYSDLKINILEDALTSVGLTMPSAFSIANSPLTANGTIDVTANGFASQYIRGDGQLASFPDIAGGGGGQVYYLNGGTSQGTIGGNSFYQLSTGASLASDVNFTSGNVDDVVFANFITDVGKPTQETIPAGVWIFQCYISQNNNNASSSVYATVEVYNGTTFNVISTSLAEVITGGTGTDLYTFTCAVPEYTLLVPTDRIAIRFYATGLGVGRTVTLHTQGNNLSSIQTTFTTGLAALNGLTAASQLLATGTSGSDFSISSVTDTHTFNLPTASATNRGALSSADWTTFNNKQNALSGTGFVKISGTTISYDNSVYYLASNPSGFTSNLGTVTSIAISGPLTGGTITGSGTIGITQASSSTDGYLSAADWTAFNASASSSATVSLFNYYNFI